MASSPLPPSEPLLALSRQNAYFQNILQKLLDAQSEGLLAGLGATPIDSFSSLGSRTPPTNVSQPGRDPFFKTRDIVPVRQPAPKKLGLHAARRGIGKTIADLARLKDQEARALHDEVSRRDAVLVDVEKISKKSTNLRREIETIGSGPVNAHISDLKLTEKAIDNEIHELETRLYEKKAHQRHLVREIQSLENGLESKLSSYKHALHLSEEEAREFLKATPLQHTSNQTAGVWALPPPRRTLEMAREQYQEEQRMLGRQAEDVMREKEALGEGGTIWDEVVGEVGDVEKMLQVEMSKIQTPKESVDAREGMGGILQRMDQAKDLLQNRLHMAENRSWKLLVCCIGAELQALVEGEGVLHGALKASSLEPSPSRDSEQVRAAAELAHRSEEEDDGPGPELLVSQDDL